MTIDSDMIINTVIIILLIATIIYCWRLNRLLRVIRDSRGELARVIDGFNQSTERAERSVIEMRQASQAVIDKLHIKIEKAEFLADDIGYLMDKASKAADKLSAHIQKAREILPDAATMPPTNSQSHDDAQVANHIAEAIKAVTGGMATRAQSVLPSPRSKAPAKIEPREESTTTANNTPSPIGKKISTSKAEQELMDALRKRQPSASISPKKEG